MPLQIIYHDFNGLRYLENQHFDSDAAAFDAGVALTRLDERIAPLTGRRRFLERQNFADACARCGSTANSSISKTSSSTTPSRMPAPQPTNSPSPAISCAPAGGFQGSRPTGLYPQKVLGFCDKRSDAGAIGAEAAEPAGIMRHAPAVHREGRGTIKTR